MDKKNKISIIIFVFVIIFLITMVCIYLISDKKATEDLVNQKNGVCKNLNNLRKSDKNFIIYLKAFENFDLDTEDLISQLESDYKDVTFFEVNYNDLSFDCVKSFFEKDGDFSELNSADTVMLGYTGGKEVGITINPVDYDNTVSYFTERGVLKPIVIKESLTLDNYKSKIKSDKYLLGIVYDESQRSEYKKTLKKVFEGYDVDVIGVKSDEGSKIVDYLKKNYKIIEDFPAIVYINNGVLKVNESGFYESDLMEYKALFGD